MKLIVTEKDSAAKKIAEILGGKVAVKEHGRGRQKVRSYHFTMDGDDAVAVGLRGHVMETVFPNTYKRWSLKYLGDMIEKPDLAWVVDGGAAGTLAALRAVAKGATELVIATDYDREGELIGHEAIEILRGDALKHNPGDKPEKKKRKAARPRTAPRCAPWDLKGILEEFFDQIGIKGCSYAGKPTPAGGLFIEVADINLGKLYLGQMGQLSPLLLKSYDLRDPVWLAEVDLDMVLYRRSTDKSFTPLPAFPSIRRDLAMLVGEAVTHDAVIQTIKQAKPAFLESVELFDVFRGKNVAEGRKSMAYAFIYRNAERTLTDAEVNTSHAGVVEALKQKLGTSVRE